SVDAKIVGAEDLRRAAAIFGCTGEATVQLRDGAVARRRSSIRGTCGGRGRAFRSRLLPCGEGSARGSSGEQANRNPTCRHSHFCAPQIGQSSAPAVGRQRDVGTARSLVEKRTRATLRRGLAEKHVDENP